jgi:predicted ribonuclease YlaK
MVVITELHGLGHNFGSVGDSAKAAIITINKVITERKDVRIITAKNSDVTKAGFFREKLEREEDDETRNIDDIIIRMTQYQSKARRQAFTEKGIIGLNSAVPAILLTEDTNMRVKANARGVLAISTTILKRYLLQLGNKALPARSKRTMVIKIKSELDEIDTPTFDFPMHMNGTVESKPKIHLGKRRAHKRGKTDMEGIAYTGAK